MRLLGFLWLVQTVYILVYLLVISRSASQLFTLPGTLLLLSWVLAAVTLGLGRLLQLGLAVYMVHGVVLAALFLHLIRHPDTLVRQSEWNIPDELLLLHIGLALCSYAAFTLGAFWSGMYLFLHRRLKEKQWTSSLKRLPSLEKLERYSFRAAAAGAPLLLLAMGLGIVFLFMLAEHSYMTDWKVLSSFLVLALYAYYMACSMSRRMPGHRLAVWNLGAYGFLLVNFLCTNRLSEFHQWIWM